MRIYFIFVMLLSSMALCAQSVDRIWQPYPFTILAGAIPTEGGAMLALEAGTSHEVGMVPLRLVGINADMEELWNRPIVHGFWGGTWIRQLQRIPDGRIFVAASIAEPCQDVTPLTGYLVWSFLDEFTGDYLEGDAMSLFSSNFQYFMEQHPLMVWDGEEMMRLLRRLDRAFVYYLPETKTWDTLEISLSAKVYLAGVALPDGRLMAQTGEALFRFSSQWEYKDTLSRFWTDQDTLLAVHALPDERLLCVFNRHLAILNTAFELDEVRVFNGEHIATAVPDGDLILMAGDGPDGPFLRRLNDELMTLETGPVMTNDTWVQAIIPTDGAYILAGRETTGVFAVAQSDPLDPGPISYDLAIDSILYDITYSNILGNTFYSISLENLRVVVINQGVLPLDSFYVTLSYPLIVNFGFCEDPGFHILINGEALEPGAQGEYLLSNSFHLMGLLGYLEDPDQLPLCAIVNGPNGKLDADHANDTYCASIALTNTGLDVSASDFPLKVWPNPASATLNLSWEGGANVHMQITNGLGQVVAQSQLNSGSQEVDVSFLPTGWYHVLLRAEDGTWLNRALFVKM
jgi:hypothetical protein